MQIVIDFNGWRKTEDIPDYLVRAGRFQLCIMTPMQVAWEPISVPRQCPDYQLIVYNTGCKTAEGLMIFSNRV